MKNSTQSKRVVNHYYRMLHVGNFNTLLLVGNFIDLVKNTPSVRGISSDAFSPQDLSKDDRMLKPLENKFVSNLKNKPILVSFDILDIQENTVIDILKTRLEIGIVYTVFVEVRYNLNHFFMAGTQFGLEYTNPNELYLVYRNVVKRLEDYMESYELDQEDIAYVELIFRKKDKVLLSDISVNKNITHIEKKVIDKDKKRV